MPFAIRLVNRDFSESMTRNFAVFTRAKPTSFQRANLPTAGPRNKTNDFAAGMLRPDAIWLYDRLKAG